MKSPEESSNQKAPVGLCPAGKIDALSLRETPTTFERKLVEIPNWSVMVELQRFLGECCPIFRL
jgi:hypothetical protein